MSCCEEAVGLPAAKCTFFLVLGAAQTKSIDFCFGSWLQLYTSPSSWPYLSFLSGASCQWVLLADNILSMVVSSLVAALQPGIKGLGIVWGNLNKGLWNICLWYLCTASSKRPDSDSPMTTPSFLSSLETRFRLNSFVSSLQHWSRRVVSEVNIGIYTEVYGKSLFLSIPCQTDPNPFEINGYFPPIKTAVNPSVQWEDADYMQNLLFNVLCYSEFSWNLCKICNLWKIRFPGTLYCCVGLEVFFNLDLQTSSTEICY